MEDDRVKHSSLFEQMYVQLKKEIIIILLKKENLL